MPRKCYLIELPQSLDRDRGILHVSDAKSFPNFLSVGVILITNITHVKFTTENFFGW